MNGSVHDPHAHKRTSINELLNPVASSTAIDHELYVMRPKIKALEMADWTGGAPLSSAHIRHFSDSFRPPRIPFYWCSYAAIAFTRHHT
jgi:hypothetical protein